MRLSLNQKKLKFNNFQLNYNNVQQDRQTPI